MSHSNSNTKVLTGRIKHLLVFSPFSWDLKWQVKCPKIQVLFSNLLYFSQVLILVFLINKMIFYFFSCTNIRCSLGKNHSNQLSTNDRGWRCGTKGRILAPGQALTSHTDFRRCGVCSPTQDFSSSSHRQSRPRRTLRQICLERKNAQSDITVILEQEKECWRRDHFLLKTPLLDYL